jgi:hypothetical protein
MPVNHGLGDELALVGPLLSALLKSGASITVWTFHPCLYSHASISTRNWLDEPIRTFEPPQCDLGLYLASSRPSHLPLRFDRTSLVVHSCKQAGWTRMTGDGSERGLSFASAYHYAAWLSETLGLDPCRPPWSFLPIHTSASVLLNLSGKGDFRKGVPPPLVWTVIESVVSTLSRTAFTVVSLTDEGQDGPPFLATRYPNLQIEEVTFGSDLATRRYCEAGLIVSSEGGGYHMAYGAGIKALLVTSSQWFAHVKEYALPPIEHYTLLHDEGRPNDVDPVVIASGICDWILQNSPTA